MRTLQTALSVRGRTDHLSDVHLTHYLRGRDAEGRNAWVLEEAQRSNEKCIRHHGAAALGWVKTYN